MADVLAFWHPTNDEALPSTWFQWGTVARGSADDISFRIRNTSATYDANNVTVSLIASGTPGSPAAQTQHFLSDDGYIFTASATISSIPAATMTTQLWLRRVTPSTATTGGPFGFQITATAESWT